MAGMAPLAPPGTQSDGLPPGHHQVSQTAVVVRNVGARWGDALRRARSAMTAAASWGDLGIESDAGSDRMRFAQRFRADSPLYKAQKEAFVSGSGGTSLAEVNLICAVTAVSRAGSSVVLGVPARLTNRRRRCRSCPIISSGGSCARRVSRKRPCWATLRWSFSPPPLSSCSSCCIQLRYRCQPATLPVHSLLP